MTSDPLSFFHFNIFQNAVQRATRREKSGLDRKREKEVRRRVIALCLKGNVTHTHARARTHPSHNLLFIWDFVIVKIKSPEGSFCSSRAYVISFKPGKRPQTQILPHFASKLPKGLLSPQGGHATGSFTRSLGGLEAGEQSPFSR